MKEIFEAIFEKAKTYCRDKTDLTHLITALEMAEKLIHLEGGNERIIIPAIILHDTGWHMFSYEEELKARKIHRELEGIRLLHQHEIESAKIAKKLLAELNWPPEEKKEILGIISWHDTKTRLISKEAKIVKDADVLSRYIPECFELFTAKFNYTEEKFFEFLEENTKRWFQTKSAKDMAREYLLKRQLKISEDSFEKELPNKVYKILIKLEDEIAEKIDLRLEELIINNTKEKARDLSKTIKLYLINREYLDLKQLQDDEEFYALVTQKVGESGYFGIIDRKTGQIIFHPDRRIINLSPEEVEKKYRPSEYLHGFWDWQKKARDGEEIYSYYQGMNVENEVVDKFQYMIPLDIKDAQWSLVCAATHRDFFKHIEILSQNVIQLVGNVSKQIEELTKKLFYEKEQLEVTLRSIGDGVIVTDAQGKAVLLNKVAEKLTGFREKEVMGKPTCDFFYIINETTRQRCENPVKKVIQLGHVVGLANNTVLITKDGQERIIADSGAPIHSRDGQVAGVILVFRDITEQKQMQEKLIKTEKLAAVTQMASEVAHEIKNPLAVIKAGLYYLKKTLLQDQETQKILSQLNDATERATNYVNDLLSLSRPPLFILKSLEVNKLIEDCFEELPQGTLTKIEIKKELAIDLPLMIVDPDRLKQVFLNLIKNAVESMKEVKGKRKLAVKSKKEGNFVKISISDTGKGVTKEDLKQIFNPFFTTKKSTGLGLAICQRVVNAHQGQIEVKSQVNKGTTFVVKLPIQKNSQGARLNHSNDGK
ncbi:PAS domain S-box protein [bacterium]|nr:PAS domain S-box protein [bacterium]